MAALSEDFGLRRLFRPALESMTIHEQIPYYTTRDLVQSRNSRLGSSRPRRVSPSPRRRVIDTSLCCPVREEDGECQGSSVCKLPFRRKDLFTKQKEHQRRPDPPLLPRNAYDDTSFPPALTTDNYHQYKEWISERKAMREGLNSMGLTKSWLCGKERSPLENKALQSLVDAEKRKKKDSDMLRQLLEMETVYPKARTPPPPKPPPPPPPRMPAALPKLELFLERSRLRLLDFFKRMDHNKDWFVTMNDFKVVVKHYNLPITDKECEELFTVIETKKKGKMSYKEFLRGISRWSSKLTRSSSHLHHVQLPEQEAEDICDENEEEKDSTSEEGEAPIDPDSVENSPPNGRVSTLDGSMRDMDIHYKVKLQKEFEDVCRLCKDRGLVLERTLLERALLLPEDSTKEECMERLSGNFSASLLPQHRAARHKTLGRNESRLLMSQSFGGAYMEMRGPSRSKRVTLSTGRTRIAPKTDCWMTFDEYIQFAMHHQPLFPYKHQKPSDSSVFWPGALLDKLRLCLDTNKKTCTVGNIFQPIEIGKTPSPSVKPPVCGWPQNEGGYVQFGTMAEKRCAL